MWRNAERTSGAAPLIQVKKVAYLSSRKNAYICPEVIMKHEAHLRQVDINFSFS